LSFENLDGMRVEELMDPLVDRHPGAHGEDRDGDDESPEVHLLAVSEGELGVGWPPRGAQAVEQENLVSRVDHGVDSLGEHGGASADGGRDELRGRDQRVPDQRCVDNFLGRRGHVSGIPPKLVSPSALATRV
jgi:hypothetical protein